MRLREKTLPGVLAPDGTYELIKLEDGAHPAESTTMLYDEKRCFLYMQRNLHGVSIKALEILLQQLSGPNVSVELKVQMKTNSLARIVDTNAYRHVLLVADTEQMDATNTTPTLAEAINNAKSFGGKVLKLELGFGRQRTGILNSKKTAQLVKEAYGYTGIQNLSVSTAENEDTAFETIDLLKDRQGYNVEVKYSQQNPVTHEKLYYLCLKEYKEEMGISLDE